MSDKPDVHFDIYPSKGKIEIYDANTPGNQGVWLSLETVREISKRVMEKELRELVEQWRDNVPGFAGFDPEIAQRNRTFKECADELEAVLNDE